jgi:hypothetical protein
MDDLGNSETVIPAIANGAVFGADTMNGPGPGAFYQECRSRRDRSIEPVSSDL